MTRPEPAAAPPQTALRERIREAVAAARPIEASRQALELIVESSVRLAPDGTVVVHDGHGGSRTGPDGAPVALSDLVAELRQQHPLLFGPSSAVAEAAPATEAPAGARERDWLALGMEAAAPSPLAPSPLAAAPAASRRSGPAAGRTRPGRRALAAAAALPVLAGLLFLAAWPGRRAVDAVPAPPPPQAAAPEPVSTGALVEPAPGPAKGVPEVLDTATLSLNGRVVRLFGVEWSRGAGEPDELARYLRGREVECTPAPGEESYRCVVEGQDLSRVVLWNGGGRARAGAPPELTLAEAHARARRVGLWADKQPSPDPGKAADEAPAPASGQASGQPSEPPSDEVARP